ncbi:MAG: hypothetical protein WAU81_09915 [Candidatus Aminicenantales bacterium]
MSAKRLLALSFLITLLVSLLYPQTLAEIAKKERERRAKLKGRTSVVVTNADLAKMKKKPALEIPPAPPELLPGNTEAPEAPPSTAAEPQEPPATTAFPPESSAPADLKTLQERWEKAKEYVELLTLKMSALWQEFYGLGDAGAKEAVQQAIAETFIKLQNAQEEETQVRLELEKFLQQQKAESTPPIWIR